MLEIGLSFGQLGHCCRRPAGCIGMPSYSRIFSNKIELLRATVTCLKEILFCLVSSYPLKALLLLGSLSRKCQPV